MEASDSFNTIGDAFVWYVGEGGQRQKTSFYAAVPRTSGSKRISRFAVSEMLRKERTQPSGVSRADEREEWEIRKLKADVEAKENANRKEDDLWMLKDEAIRRINTILIELDGSLRHHFFSRRDELILHCAGTSDRGPEFFEAIEDIISKSRNEVVRAGRIRMTFAQKAEE